MPQPRRALLLANHNARRCEELAEQASLFLRAAGLELVTPQMGGRDDVSRLIEEHAGTVDRVVVVGGDGTINAALPGILKTGLPLGIIPAGTANDLAATLGLPSDVARAADVIIAGTLRDVDVGLVNGIPFINAASMGLSVQITRALTRPLKKRWGALAYAIVGAKAIWQARPFGAVIESEQGTTYLRTVQIVVGNGRYFGTGMTVDEVAQIDDGTLHLYSVGVYHWWSLLALLPALRFGTHRSKKSVYNGEGTEFTITTRRPRSITADGEILSRTPARFELRRNAIRIFTPSDVPGTPASSAAS